MSPDWQERYDDASRERLVAEPAKRVDAPVRTPFERDRARVVHAASLRRLAAKTQVVGPQSDDFVRNRLTHSLEVAQIARDLAHPLGCHPDLAETAALAHDLGHPPFGHNGERVLNDLAVDCGGFEGNAQTLRILTRLEAKSSHDGVSLGLNLTRATLDACVKYPWGRDAAPAPSGVHGDGVAKTLRKFGVYDDDRSVFDWMRAGVEGTGRCVEAQVMDIADDVAYSVHDLEDGIVAGKIDLAGLTEASVRAEIWETARAWYLPGVDDDEMEAGWSRLQRQAAWPTSSYDGSRAGLATLKNLTSDLIGVFCGAVQTATAAAVGERPLVRHDADLVVPAETDVEIALLKSVAAHFVMQAEGRVALMTRQRALLRELFDALVADPAQLDAQFADDLAAADGEGARLRVFIDQLASLTDASAISWHARLCS